MSESRALLHGLPLLKFLPSEVRNLVVDSFVPASFPFGTPIVREGEPSDAFYVLASGRARVVKAGDHDEEISLNVLVPGDSFGEMGLVDGQPRGATVRASTDLQVFRLDRSVFSALLTENPDIRRYLELHVRHRSLHNFFRIYRPFTRLPVESLGALLEELRPVAVAAGQRIIREGDPAGPLYVIERGRARVFTEEDGREHPLAFLRRGDFFGEMSVFRGAPRSATVEAVSDCRLLALEPQAYRKLLETIPSLEREIDDRIARYDYKHVARVPLDFAEELLPAEARAQEKVSPDQAGEVEEEGEETAARRGPFASRDGRFVRSGKRIRRFPLVRQIDEADCGAACLAMVCRHFGRAVSLARIRQLLHTSTDGTSLRALCHGAEELGLAARSVKASKRNLPQMPLPAIAHWEGNHWVVVYDADESHIRIVDPAIGPRRIPRAE